MHEARASAGSRLRPNASKREREGEHTVGSFFPRARNAPRRESGAARTQRSRTLEIEVSFVYVLMSRGKSPIYVQARVVAVCSIEVKVAGRNVTVG